MKRLTLSSLTMLAMVAALAAAPVDARRTPVRSVNVWENIVELERDVNQADNRDTISEREAAGLRAQIAELKADYNRLNRNGMGPAEAGKLQSRINQLRARLKNERRDPDHHRH